MDRATGLPTLQIHPTLDGVSEPAKVSDRFADFARHLAAARSSEDVLKSVAVWVSQLIECDRASLTIPSREAETPAALVVHGFEGNSVIPAAAHVPIAGSTVGRVFVTGVPEYVGDNTASDCIDATKLGRAGLLSSAVVPLTAGNDVMGTLNIARKAKNAFSEADVKTLGAIASIVAVHLSVHERLSQTQDRLRRSLALTTGMSKVIEFSRVLFALEHDQEIYRAAANALPDVTDGERWSIATTCDSPAHMELRGISGRTLDELAKRIPMEGTLVGQTFRERRMAVVNDFRGTTHFDVKALVGAGLNAGVVVPFTIGTECVGTLNVARREVGAFDEASVLLLQHCAATISQALASARARRALRAAQESAEQASSAKGAFVASVTHELRTPLNGVIGMTHVLADTGLTSDQKEAVDTIRASSALLLSLVSDVLDFSKVEAGKLELNAEPFSPEIVIRDTVATVRGLAQSKGLDLDIEVELARRRRWVGDDLRVRQILTNLTSNAIKFTDEGRVVVRATGLQPRGVRFEVEDTGIGVTPEARHHIFEPFRQADGSTTRTHGGTGLGLALCRRITRAMGGDISVHPATPKGSVFRVDLPLREAAPADGEMVGERTTHALDRTLALAYPASVLVVDDNAVNLLVVRRLLQRLGYSNDQAQSGPEAVQLFARNTYDLVLLDLQMPGMDGIETLTRFRKTSRRMPHVAILTADGRVSTRTRCLGAGVDSFLTKPIRMPELVETIIASSPGGAHFLGGEHAAPASQS